jgi:acetolactate synthase I/II/III large subunit
MKAAELFVRQLEEEGVTCLFGLPGEENLHLLEAVRKANLKVVITRHEQAAAFMAATFGRLTGRAGVCFSTLGPGATGRGVRSCINTLNEHRIFIGETGGPCRTC